MNILKHLFFFITGIVLFSSCQKIVNQKPVNYVSGDALYSTPGQVLQALYGAYASVQASVTSNALSALNITNDDSRGEDVISTANFQQLIYQGNSFTTTTGTPINTWAGFYGPLNNITITIAGINSALTNKVITADVASQYIGECTFLRAFCEHELTLSFARPWNDGKGSNTGVPYFTFPIRTNEDIALANSFKRPIVDSDYARMIADLRYSVNNLPNSISPDFNTRATKAAAIALLMRVYLNQNNWDSIINLNNSTNFIPIASINPNDPATTGTSVGGWQLETNPANPFNTSTSIESVFSIQNTANNNPGTNAALASFFGGAGAGGRGLIAISPIIWNNTIWDSSDLRRSLYEYDQAANAKYDFFTLKYPNTGSLSDNAPQIRYAEPILSLAEAYARSADKQDTSKAFVLLNVVRNRSIKGSPTARPYGGGPNNVATADSLTKLILLERRIEFLCEGKRWMDISRLMGDANNQQFYPGATRGIPAKYVNGAGDNSQVYVYGNSIYGFNIPINPGQPAIPYSSQYFIWPLPQRDVDLNPNLVQNPGY